MSTNIIKYDIEHQSFPRKFCCNWWMFMGVPVCKLTCYYSTCLIPLIFPAKSWNLMISDANIAPPSSSKTRKGSTIYVPCIYNFLLVPLGAEFSRVQSVLFPCHSICMGPKQTHISTKNMPSGNTTVETWVLTLWHKELQWDLWCELWGWSVVSIATIPHREKCPVIGAKGLLNRLQYSIISISI